MSELRRYSYVGSGDNKELLSNPAYRQQILSASDVLKWITDTAQMLDPDGCIIATFIIDVDHNLWIADRHSEHIVCARGGDVLSAGEITFAVSAGTVEVVEITNQSTGFCPEPESWQVVADALDWANIAHPGEFTTAYLFRRCDECGTTNIIKDDWFECGVCGAALSKTWNYAQ